MALRYARSAAQCLACPENCLGNAIHEQPRLALGNHVDAQRGTLWFDEDLNVAALFASFDARRTACDLDRSSRAEAVDHARMANQGFRGLGRELSLTVVLLARAIQNTLIFWRELGVQRVQL